jgi:hypothetical protein
MKDILLILASGCLGAALQALWDANQLLNDHFDELMAKREDEANIP